MTPTIIKQIEAAMALRGSNPNALAKALGYTQAAPIRRILNGQHEPGDDLLQRIADALDVSLTRPSVTFTPCSKP